MALTKSESGKLGWLASINKRKEQYNQMRKKYNDNPKKCKSCNKIIDYDHRRSNHCNHSCALKINKSPNICQNCGNITENKYCSKNCQRIYEFIYKRNNNLPIRRKCVRGYLLLTREHKCNRCKLTHWLNNLITLEVHHKDGKHNNNEEHNLELLCPNCHSITDNYKFKNKGNGRDNRRIRSGNGTAPAL